MTGLGRLVRATCASGGLALLAACSGASAPVTEDRYLGPDGLFRTVEANVLGEAGFEVIAGIDHSRLAAAEGSTMPPSRVLIWSDPVLDTEILQHEPLAALDLPLRVLAFEEQGTGEAKVIANGYGYLAARHGLPAEGPVRARYEACLAKALADIPPGSVGELPAGAQLRVGLVTLDSPHDFATTEDRILQVIRAQDDTVEFGTLDFAGRARAQGVTLPPLRLILFGAPGPGGKAMRSAPELGLDAFCQKLLIWQDRDGSVHVTLNDLLALAERHRVSPGLPLRMINRRLVSTFAEALER